MRRASPRVAAQALAGLLVVTGSLHFASPGSYDPLIPPALPGRARWWTYGSGVAELGCAVAVALPRTRRRGGLACAALFAAVLPGNAWMAWRWRHRGPGARLFAYGRLPLQWPLIRWALYAAEGQPRPGDRLS